MLRDVEWWHRDPARHEVMDRFAHHRLEGRHEAAGSLLAFSSRQPFLINEGALEYALRTLRSGRRGRGDPGARPGVGGRVPAADRQRRGGRPDHARAGTGPGELLRRGGRLHRRPVPARHHDARERPLLRPRAGHVRAAAAQHAHRAGAARPRRGRGPVPPGGQGGAGRRRLVRRLRPGRRLDGARRGGRRRPRLRGGGRDGSAAQHAPRHRRDERRRPGPAAQGPRRRAGDAADGDVRHGGGGPGGGRRSRR